MAEPTLKQIHDRRRRIFRNTVLVGGGLAALFASQIVCLPTLMEGVWLDECPSGDLRQTISVDATGLRRGSEGWAEVRVRAHYTNGPADQDRSTNVRQFRTELFLVDSAGSETPLEVRRWDLYGGVQTGHVTLPDVPDGDYLLRTKVRSAISQDVLDSRLPLYAPAKIHVLTDRPLYEPGNRVQFRAVALKAADRVPIPDRPGKWMVLNPSGEVLLEEAMATGEWGVVAGSFPLDSLAESGTWTVRYVSGQDSGELRFQVEPFTLPRFRVEAAADAPWYTQGDTPTVTGRVVYSSGAPVEGATLEVSWNIAGRWPPPTSWREGGLPTTGSTDRDGNFTLTLPMVPADLVDTVTLTGTISAVDAAGDRVVGRVTALLSADEIAASAVTELADGLVESFNNRVYLRVTTPDGRPLPGAAVTVRRAWDATDRGSTQTADADGVAALQIDPGAPVNVVIPALPARPPPRKQPIQRTRVQEMISGSEPVLADRLAMDRWTSSLESCALWVDGGDTRSVTLGLMIEPSGAVSALNAGGSELERCLTERISRLSAAPGRRRLLRAEYQVSDPELPVLNTSISSVRSRPPVLERALSTAALRARACLPDDAPSTVLPRALTWQTTQDSTSVSLRWTDSLASTRLSPAAVACVERTIEGLSLDDDATETAMGVISLSTTESRRISAARPQPTTMLGYELAISAAVDGESVGSTTMRFSPGSVPPLRIRADAIIAAPGDAITFTFVRGPDFVGDLSGEVQLAAQDGSHIKGTIADRAVSFTLPQSAEGWYTLAHAGAISRVFVPPAENLTLDLTADATSYAPGDVATLHLQTTSSGQGVAAAVGLFGVDESLAQLAPLPGPGAMSDALVEAPTLSPAFGVLDGTALVMGRIRGENAAAAAVLRVTDVPTPAELDREVSVYDSTRFDPVEELTDRFYTVLAELHVQTRQWERDAAEGEQMSPKIMAGLWGDALDACRARGEDVTDAYGRPLRLHRLPGDLLAMTDPHEVVLDGGRLPEDVENWTAWVHKEQP